MNNTHITGLLFKYLERVLLCYVGSWPRKSCKKKLRRLEDVPQKFGDLALPSIRVSSQSYKILSFVQKCLSNCWKEYKCYSWKVNWYVYVVVISTSFKGEITL